jgi:trans-aconitate 2-methyltransferase
MSEPANSREWNAAEYHRLSAPQFQWGQRVLSKLRLREDECLLDAGCGSGRLTRLLLESVPRGRVFGVDLSRNMLRHAQQELRPDFGGQIGLVNADLSALPFLESFDGIFSTASFHWVKDHDVLFRNLFAALRPGGWLHAQCGGGSNLLRLRQRVSELALAPEFSKWLGDFSEPWFFADAEGTAERLRDAGFRDVETGVEAAPVAVPTSEEFQEYLRTFVLHRHLELLPSEALRGAFVLRLAEDAAQDDPAWTLDYWRLNLQARKLESSAKIT